MGYHYLFQKENINPKMDDSGWKFFQTNGQSFIVRRCFSTTNFKLLLSDHRRLWCTEGTASELLKMSCKENPLCEFDNLKVTKNIFNLFDRSLNSLTVDGADDTSRSLKMSSSLGNMPFSLVWTLIEQGPDELFKEVTQPMLYFIGEMSKRQEYLCGLLIEKDKEINEHVHENGTLMWSKIKTEKFNEGKFRNESLIAWGNDQDPIKIAWKEEGVLGMFNKTLLQEEKDHEDGKLPKVNEELKQETISEAFGETVDKSEVTNVKEERIAMPLSSKPSQTKRKKPKLNL